MFEQKQQILVLVHNAESQSVGIFSFCEEEQMKAVQHIEEWYFLPDPDKFIYFCYPEQSDWQLLPEPWTLEKFVKTPLVTSFYLQSHWHLADTLESVVLAPSGKCCIQMDRVTLPELRSGFNLQSILFMHLY